MLLKILKILTVDWPVDTSTPTLQNEVLFLQENV